MKNFQDTKYVAYSVLETPGGDVLSAVYKDFVTNVDLAMAKEIRAARIDFQGERTFFLMIQEPGAIKFTWEALHFFSSEDGVQGLIAIAMIVRNYKSLATGTFLKDVQQPLRPTQIVETEEEALAWFASMDTQKTVYDLQ